jgi:ElaB/YqjD/DUF883 family membrane-anchored ribosome-binding protein
MNHKQDPSQDFQKEIDDLKNNVSDLKALFVKKISRTAESVPQAIHMGEERIAQAVETHPFSSVGLAAAVGFIIGALVTGKK